MVSYADSVKHLITPPDYTKDLITDSNLEDYEYSRNSFHSLQYYEANNNNYNSQKFSLSQGSAFRRLKKWVFLVMVIFLNFFFDTKNLFYLYNL